MDFNALHSSVHKRLLWINSVIRQSRKDNNEVVLSRYKEYRRVTDQLLSKINICIIKGIDDRGVYIRLDQEYKQLVLI